MWVEDVTLVQKNILRRYGRTIGVCQKVGRIEHCKLAKPIVCITHRESIFFCEYMIHLAQQIMKVLVIRLRETQLTVGVTSRNTLQEVYYRRIRCRRALGNRRNGRLAHVAEVAQACSLVRTEEECFVFDDGAANRPAKLVPLKLVATHILCGRTIR